MAAGGGFGDKAIFTMRHYLRILSLHVIRLQLPSAIILLALLLGALIFVPPARAQDAKPGVVGLGDLVVTGASGTVPPPANPPLPPGVSELDETFIDTNGASLKVFDVSNPGGPPEAQLLNAPVKFQAFARDTGQLFGLALDTEDAPNIYAASTSVLGLQIVVPDADGDGRPERIKSGQPGAQWMEGQFGLARGGGPGTVWKIDGETGEITKFADIQGGGVPNSGPGLGNIAYDEEHKQFFVSDLDTGLIHRLDLNGADLGTFDHGLQGRPANGMGAVQDDGRRADITSPTFDAEDPGTWGFTAPERRVWGVAIYKGRAYYAVESGPQIWSIGINEDGSFGSDPRWELDVPADPDSLPVSDIAFQASGLMLLAQRGGISSRYDYSRYHTPRKSRVLRYRLEGPDDPATPSRWVAEPEDYAIGFPGTYRNASGGIAVGYAYQKNADGSYAFGSCEGTLWSTGDALRDNPVHGAKLAAGGPLNVNGLQGNALDLVRPENEPPWVTYFADYDGNFEDPEASGHVGDVEIARDCKRKHVMDLRILKQAHPERCAGGNECPFSVVIENTGSKVYTGPLEIEDIAHNGATLVGHAPPSWSCEEIFAGTGVYRCTHPEVTLGPGEKIVLELTLQLPGWWDRPVYNNCVELRTPGSGIDERPYNNRSCDYVPTGTAGGAPDLRLEKFGAFWSCDWFGVCTFAVRIINVGGSSYTGPLSVHDFINQPGASLIGWDPDPPWTCAAGPGPGSYDCSHPAPVTLSPGEFRELILHVQGPPPWAGHAFVRNCAYIEWDGIPRDHNPFNEYDCAEISLFPPGHPLAQSKLDIDKKASPICAPPPAGPGGGWLCSYWVTVTNTGGLPYGDEIEVKDVTDAIGAGPGTLVNHGDPPWTCAPGGGAGEQTCKRPPGMLPGESVTFWVQFEVPAATATPNGLKNCAKIKHDNDGDGVAEEIEDCDIALICTPGGGGDCPQDMVVAKTVQAEPCWPGFDCKFTVTFGNLGTAAHPAGLVIHDIPNPDAGPLNVPGIPPAIFSCAPAGPNYDCTVHVPIAAGGVGVIPFEFPVPPAYPWTTLKNCAKIDPSANNLLPWNDEGCATAFIPGPDLAPWGGTECNKKVPCPLVVTVDNKGKRPFKGAAGLKGTLSPAVKITSIKSQTPGFPCSITGNGTYKCKGKLSLAPGAAAKLQLTILVPESFKGTRITHTKEMEWPDKKVKDRNPENDKHVSIITIKQPKEPEPTPPPPTGMPDIAVTKRANQGACTDNQPCGWTAMFTNVGNATYTGPLRISDTVTPGAALAFGGPPPWTCTVSGGGVECSHPNTTLQPGQSITLSLIFTTPSGAQSLRNCVALRWGGSSPTRRSTRDVQQALKSRGFAIKPDGKAGPNTRRIIRQFQQQKGLPATGRIDQALLSALFGATGAGDSNPANDRACALVSITAGTPPPPPPCTGGRNRNNQGVCVCPSSIPVWTGERCIPRPPKPCTGGRYRNNRGVCVCPTDRPVWTGKQCIIPPCPDGQIRNNYGQCTCPPNKPVWNGKFCAPRIPVCSGGQVFNLQFKKCVCPPNKPVWNGKFCAPRIPVCTGGRVFNPKLKKCVCPSNKPVWNGKFCAPRTPVCTGGRVFNLKLKQCVCPPNKPRWNGKQCISYTTTPPPTGPSELQCTGGRSRNSKGQCVCPSNKPVWTGKLCIPRLVIKPQQGPTLQINPNLLKKVPKIQ